MTSDNGPENTYPERLRRFDHASAGGLRGGKRDIYEGGHRVPFIVRWLAVVEPATRSARLVSQTDLLATFAELLGKTLAGGEGEDSVSFLPLLEGKPRAPRAPLIHHSASGYFAIRDGRWKLNMIRGSGGSLQPRANRAQTRGADLRALRPCFRPIRTRGCRPGETAGRRAVASGHHRDCGPRPYHVRPRRRQRWPRVVAGADMGSAAKTSSASVNDPCTNPPGIPSTLRERERGVFPQPGRRPQP